ncbi:hypothetical protein G5C51_14650 [Streptomyces sp. A7024]|uniref:Uncharacterized protein n=1 Tax=Streptomyces coryli TaxID=1128680 RepID=A0A6G4TZE9_9ACTN|nr:hypothetical protein [Streptomyces coryli]NGN65132.1 hypothetical protein [Streptomyces coryli]
MTLHQQYALDAARAAQHGVPAPPAPELNVWRVIRQALADRRRARFTRAA